MLRFFTIAVTLFIAGCMSVNQQVDYDYVELDLMSPIMVSPGCIPGKLGSGYKEGCIKDLQDYDAYLGRYLKEAYEVFDLPDPDKGLNCQRDKLSMPYIKPRPTITENATNKSKDELIAIVTKYTYALQVYNSYIKKTYLEHIERYNRECNNDI